MSEIDPLVERVDALLKRHQQPPADRVPQTDAPPPPDDDDIPVLTEVVETIAPALPPVVEPDLNHATRAFEAAPLVPAPPPAFDEKALVAEIESAVIEKLRVQLDQSLPSKLNRLVGDLLDQAVDGLRADLSNTVRETVRQAVDKALGEQPDEHSSDSRKPPVDS